MFGLTTVVLDSRRDVFDRITMGTCKDAPATWNSGCFRHAYRLGEAVSLLERNSVDTLFVHTLDCDENKLIEALRCMPGKLPARIMLYGAYSSTVSKFAYALEAQFTNTINIQVWGGDL